MSDAPPSLNMVVYLNASAVTIRKDRESFCVGGHGYTYNPEIEGKKSLKKDVATSMGYYTGNPHKAMTVVDVSDIVSLNAPNQHSKIAGLLNVTTAILQKLMATPDAFKNLCLITAHKELHTLLKADLTKLAAANYKVGRNELNQDEIDALVFAHKLVNEWQAAGHKFILDLDGAVEGGKGNKSANQQLGLTEAITRWSTDTQPSISIIPRKEYENPESDFNKVITASRWYFNTGEGSNFYDLVAGYRAYAFGKVEPDKKYYGKMTPDVTYAKLYTKEPITILDKLFEYTKRTVKNPNELLSAGNLTNVKSKDLLRLIDTYPAIRDGENLVMPYQVGGSEEPMLIELINPPMLSYLIKEALIGIDVALDKFLGRDAGNKNGYNAFYDITDKIYVKEENKKGDIKLKISPDFGINTTILKLDVEHRNAVKPVMITLGVGYDTPDRVAFNSISDPDVKVWVCVDGQNEQGLRYCTLVETNEFIYVHTSAIANLRVLNLAELGKK